MALEIELVRESAMALVLAREVYFLTERVLVDFYWPVVHL